MKKMLLSLAVCTVLPLAALGADYEVTITNLTHGQVFTPVLVASHKGGVKLFTPGSAASVELEMLAEGGNTAPLAALLNSMPEVGDVADSGAPIPPGTSATVRVASSPRFRYVSLAGMLVPTNDGFVVLNGVEGHFGYKALEFLVPAWDAGTEANDESCASIPGPPGVCGGEGFNASRDGAEGYVHIHRGIHGGGDLDPAERDWRNPVARIVIRRVR